MSNIEKLREKAKSLGIEVDGRWTEARLTAEIQTAEEAGKTEGDSGASGEEWDGKPKDKTSGNAQLDTQYLELKILEHEETIKESNKAIEELKAYAEELEKTIADLEGELKKTKSLVGRASNTDPEDFTQPFMVKNLTKNRVRSLGLEGGGSVVIGDDQLKDEVLMKRIKHGIAIGTLARG